MGGGATVVVSIAEVGRGHPSLQVITDVTVRVLVAVTGLVMVDEPVTMVLQVTGRLLGTS